MTEQVDPVLALRPFIGSKDHAKSRQFYERLGFKATYADKDIVILTQGSFSFILQNFYVKEWAENTMVQLLVRDADAWWKANVDGPALVADFAVQAPRAPSMQRQMGPRGMKAGFIWDPAGVLWHVTDAPL